MPSASFSAARLLMIPRLGRFLIYNTGSHRDTFVSTCVIRSFFDFNLIFSGVYASFPFRLAHTWILFSLLHLLFSFLFFY